MIKLILTQMIKIIMSRADYQYGYSFDSFQIFFRFFEYINLTFFAQLWLSFTSAQSFSSLFLFLCSILSFHSILEVRAFVFQFQFSTNSILFQFFHTFYKSIPVWWQQWRFLCWLIGFLDLYRFIISLWQGWRNSRPK